MEFSRRTDRCRPSGRRQQVSVAIAEGSHPFPFRTRKLSLPAPMVLGPSGPGRVGRRRISHTSPAYAGLVAFLPPVRDASMRRPGVAISLPVRSAPIGGVHRGVSCHVERPSPEQPGLIWIRLRPWKRPRRSPRWSFRRPTRSSRQAVRQAPGEEVRRPAQRTRQQERTSARQGRPAQGPWRSAP